MKLVKISQYCTLNKTGTSKECDICHYWYLLNKGFKFQPNICNRCHDLLMRFMNLSNIVILSIKGSDYRCIISRISKNQAINLMQNTDSTKKMKNKNLLSNINMSKEILTFEDIEIEKK